MLVARCPNARFAGVWIRSGQTPAWDDLQRVGTIPEDACIL